MATQIGIAFVVLGAWLPAAAPADWPGWHGPHRDGSAPGVILPAALPAAMREEWRVPAGEGYSGPVVAGGKVVIFCRRGEKETLLGLDAATGKEQWKDEREAPFKPEEYSKVHGKGPFSTPAVAGGKVYSQGITGVLSCHDLATGAVVWRKDFAGEFKKPHPIWGSAASPLIEGRLCIAWIGTEESGGLGAFDAATGAPAWKAEELEPSYSSPVAADLAGARQVVVLSRTHLAGVDPKQGKVLWKFPYKVKYEQGIVTPVVRGDRVFVAGYEEPTTCVSVSRSGGKFSAAKEWTNGEAVFFMSSPIPHGEHLYGVTQGKRGALACIGMGDGRVKWITEGGLGEYASVVAAGDRLLVLTTKGDLLLVAADPAGYKELSRTRALGERIWSHPAVIPGALLVKDRTHMVRYELPPH